jgi:hypothetical protein
VAQADKCFQLLSETVGARRSGISPDMIDDGYLWYEIGSHADDDRMIG